MKGNVIFGLFVADKLLNVDLSQLHTTIEQYEYNIADRLHITAYYKVISNRDNMSFLWQSLLTAVMARRDQVTQISMP